MRRKLALVKAAAFVPARGGAKSLLADVRGMILEARQTVARGVNAALVLLYWKIGQRIQRDILKEKRAEYGEQIVAALGRQLEREFGRGYGEKMDKVIYTETGRWGNPGGSMDKTGQGLFIGLTIEGR